VHTYDVKVGRVMITIGLGWVRLARWDRITFLLGVSRNEVQWPLGFWMGRK
jgi:hypothetical protein